MNLQKQDLDFLHTPDLSFENPKSANTPPANTIKIMSSGMGSLPVGKNGVAIETRFFLPSTRQTIEIIPHSIKEVEVIYQDIFEDHEYDQYGVAVRSGDVVLDVGANVGMFYLHAMLAVFGWAGKNGASLKYYGFEALPPTFEVLRQNIDGNAVQNVDGNAVHPTGLVKALFNMALGDEARHPVPFTYYPRWPGNSTLNPKEKRQFQAKIATPEEFEGGVEYLVPMRTLSDVMAKLGLERVDYLKVDVEGVELMVLRGLKEVDWSKIWKAVVEVSNVDKIGEDGVRAKRHDLIVKLFTKHGFEVNGHYSRDEVNYMVYAKRKE